MKMTIKDLRNRQLARIKAAIRRSGPIRWATAVAAMWASSDHCHDRFDNLTIKEFIEAGELSLSWDEQGNSFLNLVA